MLRERIAAGTRSAVDALRDSVAELVDIGMIETASVEVRQQPIPPLQKVYVINRNQVVWGYYPITERTVTVGRKKITAISPIDQNATDQPGDVAEGAALFEKSAGTNVQDDGAQFVNSTLAWFESVWHTVGVPLELD